MIGIKVYHLEDKKNTRQQAQILPHETFAPPLASNSEIVVIRAQYVGSWVTPKGRKDV